MKGIISLCFYVRFRKMVSQASRWARFQPSPRTWAQVSDGLKHMCFEAGLSDLKHTCFGAGLSDHTHTCFGADLSDLQTQSNTHKRIVFTFPVLAWKGGFINP